MEDHFFIYHAVLFLLLLLSPAFGIKFSLTHGGGLLVGPSSKCWSSAGQEAEDIDQASRRKRQDEKCFVEEPDGTDGKSRTCQVEVCLVTGLSAYRLQMPEIEILA